MFELGGDITRPLAGGAIKLVGLATRRKRDNGSNAICFRTDGGDDVARRLRAVAGRPAQRNHRPAQLDAARTSPASRSRPAPRARSTRSTARSSCSNSARTASRIRIDLPVDDATVKEKRGEVYVNVGRQLSKTLRVDGGLNYEFSQLKVRGDAIADRTPQFLKPSLTLDWKPGGGWHAPAVGPRAPSPSSTSTTSSASPSFRPTASTPATPNLRAAAHLGIPGTVEHPLLGDGLVKLDARLRPDQRCSRTGS